MIEREKKTVHNTSEARMLVKSRLRNILQIFHLLFRTPQKWKFYSSVCAASKFSVLKFISLSAVQNVAVSKWIFIAVLLHLLNPFHIHSVHLRCCCSQLIKRCFFMRRFYIEFLSSLLPLSLRINIKPWIKLICETFLDVKKKKKTETFRVISKFDRWGCCS